MKEKDGRKVTRLWKWDERMDGEMKMKMIGDERMMDGSVLPSCVRSLCLCRVWIRLRQDSLGDR